MKERYLTLAKIALVVVVFLWAACFGVNLFFLGKCGSTALGPIGQFGDAFGTVNALFTGLALVGLVYTVVLQHKQAMDQEADSRENHLALRRQGREQFLTARLNATVALIQAAEIRSSVAIADIDTAEFEQEAARREVAGLKHQLGILLHEANAGFERDWDLRVQREVIRAYLIELLSGYKLYFRGNKDPVTEHKKIMELIFMFPFQLTALARVLRQNHFLISSWVEHQSALLSGLKVHNRDEVEQWLVKALVQLSSRSDELWGDEGQDGSPFVF